MVSVRNNAALLSQTRTDAQILAALSLRHQQKRYVSKERVAGSPRTCNKARRRRRPVGYPNERSLGGNGRRLEDRTLRRVSVLRDPGVTDGEKELFRVVLVSPQRPWQIGVHLTTLCVGLLWGRGGEGWGRHGPALPGIRCIASQSIVAANDERT